MDQSPVIISIGSNDNIMGEQIEIGSSSLHKRRQSDSTSATMIKQKFVIRGGRVQRTEEIIKTEYSVPSPSVVLPELSIPLGKQETIGNQKQTSKVSNLLHPPRKRNKPNIQLAEESIADDEWSTDEEVENSCEVQKGEIQTEQRLEIVEVNLTKMRPDF
jgi:hypothetical protein